MDWPDWAWQPAPPSSVAGPDIDTRGPSGNGPSSWTIVWSRSVEGDD